jgi:cobalt-zinc-cadmium efflux system membrane fusion protein
MNWLRAHSIGRRRVLLLGTAGVLVTGVVLLTLSLAWNWRKASAGEVGGRAPAAPPRTELIAPDTLAVPAEVAKSLGLETVPAARPSRPRPLPPLAGSLALDVNRLARVRPRLAGEVVRIGEIDTIERGTTVRRPLRYGDRVEKGQLLAVVWSKDLGEKKSELVDAVSRLRLDREVLERYRDLYTKGALPERSLREQERAVEADEIALTRARRTLRSWQLPEEDIRAIEAEADRLRGGRPAGGKEEETWAQVEVRAPFAGTVVEKNVAEGDVVDTATELFKIADLSRLTVWAHAYEEQLPLLQELQRQGPIPWKVRLQANPAAEPLTGTVERIGDIIDPNQRTALVTGQVDNSAGQLLVGQFITATVELPPAADEVEIPTTALVEDGRESVVFVQPDPGKPVYAARRVAVVRRTRDLVYLRGPDGAVCPGERVVRVGALELKEALEELQAGAKGN